MGKTCKETDRQTDRQEVVFTGAAVQELGEQRWDNVESCRAVCACVRVVRFFFCCLRQKASGASKDRRIAGQANERQTYGGGGGTRHKKSNADE